MFGPALSLVAASYTGCSATLTVGLLSLGVGLMGGTMSGYRINHLDISPRFAGILMSLTNCIANVFALLAPIVAGYIIEGKVSVLSGIPFSLGFGGSDRYRYGCVSFSCVTADPGRLEGGVLHQRRGVRRHGHLLPRVRVGRRADLGRPGQGRVPRRGDQHEPGGDAGQTAKPEGQPAGAGRDHPADGLSASARAREAGDFSSLCQITTSAHETFFGRFAFVRRQVVKMKRGAAGP